VGATRRDDGPAYKFSNKEGGREGGREREREREREVVGMTGWRRGKAQTDQGPKEAF